MSAQDWLKLALAFCGALVPVTSAIAWLLRSIFTYLLKRIETLENQRDTVLTKLVGTVESQQTAINATGKLAIDLTRERELDERERRDWREGRRP